MYALSHIGCILKRLFGIILVIFLTSCGAKHLMKGHKGSYSIFGQIEGKDTGKIFLTIYDTTENGPWIIIDSTDIRDSYFHFSGAWKKPAMARIITYTPNPYFKWNFTRYFVLETGMPIKTKLFNDSIASSIFHGSVINDQLTNFNREITAMKIRFQSEYFPLRQKGIISADSLEVLEQDFDRKKYDYIISQIEKFPGSIASGFVAVREISGDDINPYNLSQIIQAFGKQNNYFTRKLEKELSIMMPANRNPIMTVPAFKIRDMNNKVYSNKKLRGEFLFINFWATWCKPCIEELPLLEEAFVGSKNKPIRFMNLSVDFDKEQWANFIEKLPPGWIEAWIGKNKSLQDKFEIRFIPANFLIDPKGRIVAKNIDGHNLFNVINVLVKNKSDKKNHR